MLSPAHQQFLKTLGNPKRVEVMLLLMSKQMTVTELMKKTGMEQSTLSHHLKRLKLCQFVKNKVNGKERIYSVNEETAGPLFRLMEKHVKKYCQRLCLAGHSTECDGRCEPS
ncbi:transcriptional regulator [Candidatus Peregrinibacteria bacterium CG10_big_fil_rev_8_21_14_0_10_49_10]|nr:MAG: transcriptional regulator [Candidatus Peregrinibacteria bacterium CG10_big_fil_rev_8_21_14_0_10_49_10]